MKSMKYYNNDDNNDYKNIRIFIHDIISFIFNGSTLWQLSLSPLYRETEAQGHSGLCSGSHTYAVSELGLKIKLI